MGHGYYINSYLFCPNPLINYNILFKIDTGCDITTINPSDHRYFGLNFNILDPPSHSISADGNISKNYSIKNCGLFFLLDKSFYVEQLDRMLLSTPEITPSNHDTIMSVPSLLGIDFLKRYSIKFIENYVVLK